MDWLFHSASEKHTFHNPKIFEYETGFYNGASSKVFEMLTFQDVNKPNDQSENKI